LNLISQEEFTKRTGCLPQALKQRIIAKNLSNYEGKLVYKDGNFTPYFDWDYWVKISPPVKFYKKRTK
jgi:hypothetical protein